MAGGLRRARPRALHGFQFRIVYIAPESELPPATGVGFDIIQRQGCPPCDWTEEWESGARHVYYGNVFVQDLIQVQVLSSS